MRTNHLRLSLLFIATFIAVSVCAADQEHATQLAVPDTNTTITIFSTRSHPMLPEFTRRLLLEQPATHPQKLELPADPVGGNVLDVYVVKEANGLRTYITDPHMYEIWQSEAGSSTSQYPQLGKTLTPQQETAIEEMVAENGPETRQMWIDMMLSQEKQWVYFDQILPLSKTSFNDSFSTLTHLGHFDTKRMAWKPSQD